MARKTRAKDEKFRMRRGGQPCSGAGYGELVGACVRSDFL